MFLTAIVALLPYRELYTGILNIKYSNIRDIIFMTLLCTLEYQIITI